MNFKAKSLIVFLFLTIQISACGSANSLSGSVSDLSWFNLSFDRVEITLDNEGLKINYYREVSGSADPDIVASVIVLREGTAIEANKDYDLAVYGSVDRFVRTRDADGSLQVDPHIFKGITAGTIRFSKLSPTSGRPIAGKFYITFTDGYTLNGSFSGNLIVQE